MIFRQTDFGNKKEILKFPDHYVAMPVTFDDAGVVANTEGKKIIPAGAIVGGNGGSVLANPDGINVNVQNDADAERIAFYDVDVTYGPRAGAMLIHAFINTSKLPAAPDPAAVTALKGRITFIK